VCGPGFALLENGIEDERANAGSMGTFLVVVFAFYCGSSCAFFEGCAVTFVLPVDAALWCGVGSSIRRLGLSGSGRGF